MPIQPVSSVITQPVGCQPLKPVEETKNNETSKLQELKQDTFTKSQTVTESTPGKSAVSFKQNNKSIFSLLKDKVFGKSEK